MHVNKRYRLSTLLPAGVGVVVLALLLRADEAVLPIADGAESVPLYVGAALCMSCHADNDRGGQARSWTGSQHALSYMAIAPAYPEMIDEQARGMVKVLRTPEITRAAKRLGVETKCLSCHTTAADIDRDRLAESFHVEDGVQCEACHGPGSDHAAWHKKASNAGKCTPVGARLRNPVEADCLACHHEKPSHAVLRSEPFNFKAAWKRIAHPFPNKAQDK